MHSLLLALIVQCKMYLIIHVPIASKIIQTIVYLYYLDQTDL